MCNAEVLVDGVLMCVYIFVCLSVYIHTAYTVYIDLTEAPSFNIIVYKMIAESRLYSFSTRIKLLNDSVLSVHRYYTHFIALDSQALIKLICCHFASLSHHDT